MSISIPEAVSSDQTITTWWVPTIVDKSAPKVTELTAVSALNVECYLKSRFHAAKTVEEVEDWRSCLRVSLATPGSQKVSIDPLTFIIDPQNQASVSNKAYAAFAEGTDGFLVVRYGVLASVAPAIGQIVDVYPVTVASRKKNLPERNSQLTGEATFMLRDIHVEDVALVA